MKKSVFLVNVAILLAFFFPMAVFAAAVGITDPLGGATLEGLLVKLTRWLLGVVGILSVLGIVYGGIRMVAAVGDEGQLSAAKNIVKWSIAGLVVAILALTIVDIVATQVLGIDEVAPPAPAGYLLPVNEAHAVDIGLGHAQDTGLVTHDPRSLARSIVGFVLSIIGLVLLVVIIWGGFTYVTSLGDEQKTAHAKKIILGGIIGLVIIGLSVIIVNVVISLFD